MPTRVVLCLWVLCMGNTMKRARSAETLRRTGEYTIANFYLNKIPSQPEGDFIDNIHDKWWGNYRKLEDHHGYVQWLFPTRTYSQFNDMSPRLTDDDIKTMKADVIVGRRLIQSYKLMLEFYGMRLVDPRTGEVCRGGKDYKLRYQETLESRTHNHLRVCRILSSFSVLGFRRYKAPLVHFLQEEAGFVEGERLGKTRALKLSPHALRMFGTYLDEESKEYLMYSGVQLPGDHADHVLFTFLGTDREDELFELPERGSAHAKASADPVIPMDGGDGRTKSTGGDDVDTEAEDGENVSCVRAAGGVEAAAIPIGDDATVGLSGILDEPSRDIEAVVGVSGETVQLTPPVPILHDEVKKPAVAGSDYEAAASEIEGADFD